MDVLGKTVYEPITKVSVTLEGVYDYFGIESMAIASGENFYQTRLFSLIKTLENLCSYLSAVEIYTTLRKIYAEAVDKVQFLICAKVMIYPYIQSENGPQGSGCQTIV